MYFALRGIKLDKVYRGGEEIPEEAIAPNMVKKLIRCGIIQKVEKAVEPRKEKTSTGEQTQEKIKADESETGKQLEGETKAEEPLRENEVENEPPKEKTRASKQLKKV